MAAGIIVVGWIQTGVKRVGVRTEVLVEGVRREICSGIWQAIINMTLFEVE